MHTNHLELRRLHQLLTPSWLSSFIALAFGVIFEAGAVVIARISNTTIQQELFAVHYVAEGPQTSYKGIVDSMSQNQVLGNLPLLVFWLGIGVIIYMVAIYLVHMFSNAYRLERELGYRNAKRGTLLATIVLHTIIRLIALTLLWITFTLLLHRILPEALLSAHNVSHVVNEHAVLSVIESFLLIVIDIWFLTIFLRLMFLRPRLFSSFVEA